MLYYVTVTLFSVLNPMLPLRDEMVTICGRAEACGYALLACSAANTNHAIVTDVVTGEIIFEIEYGQITYGADELVG